MSERNQASQQKSIFKRIAIALWGNFENKAEVKKFIFLGAIFGLIIGTYWALRPIKDSIFNAMVGIDSQPYAKLLSVVIIMALVFMYSKLVDKYPRHQVFYILAVIYTVLTLGFAFAFMNPEIGLLNTVKSSDRILGWAWYVFVESFGTLVVPLFWAITSDITLPESAKRGFPLIALFGQMGNMFGPYVLRATRFGFATSAPIVAICGVLVFLSMLLMMLFRKVTPKAQLASYHAEGEEETEPGFFEGLRLLITEGYLLGIFLINFFFEFIITVIDFHFKNLTFAQHAGEAAGAGFLADYGSLVGLISMLSVLLGINNIQRHLGVAASLLLVPALVTLAVLMIWFNPTSLTIVFWIMVISKAVNYALNQPTIKQLYIPTSKDAKFKSQTWSELFGSRGAKGSSSGFNALKKSFFKPRFGAEEGALLFVTISSVISIGLIGAWLVAALYIARVYNKAVKEDKIIC